MATIDNLTLEVNADITKAKRSLDTLATSLTNLKTKMGTVGTSYKNLAKSLSAVTVSSASIKNIKNIGDSLSTLNSVRPKNIDNIATSFKVLMDSVKSVSLSKTSMEKVREIGKIGNSLAKLNTVRPSVIQKTADNLVTLQSSLNNVTYDSINKIEKLAKALSNLSGLDPQLLKGFGRIAGRVAQIGQVPLSSRTTQRTSVRRNVITPENIDSQNLSNWEKSMFKINAAIVKVLPAFKSLRKVVSTIGSAFKKAISPVTRFLKALGRIAFYRAIRSVLKEITQGLKEGIDNLAKYSKAIGEIDALKANQVMSGYASYFLYLKNALGTALMPLLKALLPLVEAVINKFVALLDIIAQLGSAFFGLTYTSARFFWVDYAESLDNAGRSAGKLHKQLAGFDELNNLTTNSGGGGTDWGDISDYFGEMEIMQKILDLVEKIKTAWQNVKKAISDIFEPVKKVGERLKDLWDKVVEKVAPHLDRIKDAVKTIWTDGLQPLLEGLVQGFFEGYYGEEFENFPDLIGFLAEKLADCAEKIADFVKNIDNEKIKEFGEKIGYVAGFLMFMSNPLNWVLTLFDIGHSRLYLFGQMIGDWLGKKLEELHDWLEKIKEKLDLNNDGVVNLGEVITFFVDPLKDWVEENVNLNAVLDKLEQRVNKVSQKVVDFTTKVQNIIDKLREFFHTVNVNGRFDPLIKGLDKIWDVAERVKKTFEGLISINLFDWAKTIAEMFMNGSFNNTNSSGGGIPTRARGGFVSRGDLFVANERGAEMVGSLNGNTAVANNQMITEAIAQATYQAMSQALSENGMNITIEGDSDGMFKVLQKKNREYKNMTGRSAFA